jgi:hypothetical protein
MCFRMGAGPSKGDQMRGHYRDKTFELAKVVDVRAKIGEPLALTTTAREGEPKR